MYRVWIILILYLYHLIKIVLNVYIKSIILILTLKINWNIKKGLSLTVGPTLFFLPLSSPLLLLHVQKKVHIKWKKKSQLLSLNLWLRRRGTFSFTDPFSNLLSFILQFDFTEIRFVFYSHLVVICWFWAYLYGSLFFHLTVDFCVCVNLL